MSLRRRLILPVSALILAVSGTAGHVALDRWQRDTIFSVALGEQPWWREPLPGTEIFDLELGNGERVRAWYVGQSRADAPTVLYLHGARWNLNGSVFRIERWHDMGFAVLAIDYRGFGESTPRLPSQASAVQDAVAALDELARRQPDPSRRFIYGHSLGGAVAAQVAARANRPDYAGIILEATFTNIRDMLATTRWGGVPGLKWLVTQPFDSLAALARLDRPLLILHGTADRVVPPSMAHRLHEAAGDRAELVMLEGASHSGGSQLPAYREAVLRFTGQAQARHAALVRAGQPPG